MVQTLSVSSLTFCPLCLTAVSTHVTLHLDSSLSVSVDAGLDSCAPRAHVTVMVNLRTHCHFTMQARALRVPDSCDDHTTPSFFFANSFAESRCRSMHTLALPDPSLTQWGLVTFLARAMHQLFVRSCDLAHHGLYCSHVCACTHHSSLQPLLFRCLPSLFFCAHMEEQNMRLPHGTTGWNHSYYTGNPLSALHSLQQLQAGASSPPSVQVSASTWELHGAALSSSVSCPQVTHSAISPQVQTGPTRTATSDLVSATLAEAATQLSFAAFLERCIFVHASPPPQLPVSTPSLDVATQTFSHTAASRDVSTQLSFMESLASPFTLDALCPACARPVPSLVFTQRYASTQLPLTEFFLGCILSNDPLDRQALPSAHCNADGVSPPQSPDIATLCSPSSASHASDCHEDTTAPCVLPQPPLGLERYAHLCTTHGILVKAAPVRPRLCASISVTTLQPHVSTTEVGTHPVRSATTYKRSASTALAGTHNLVGADPRAGTTVLFPNHEPWFFLWSNLGNPNLTGLVTLIQLTVISCIINTSLSFSGIQARRAGTPPISLRRPVEGSMRLFFKKPVIMFRTSPISSLPIQVTRTLLSYSTRTPLSLTLWCLPSGKTPQAKVLGAWFSSSFEHCCAAPHFSGSSTVTFCSVHIHNVVAKERDASTELLQRLHGYMKHHNVDFSGGDFNMSALSTVGDVFSDPEF